MEAFNDTKTEVEEEVLETTPEETEEETVETFSEDLDKAETAEEALEAYKTSTEGNESPEEEEATEEPASDTETEADTSNILTIKNGDIELGLNLDDEKERKRIVMLAQQGLNYAEKTTELAKYKSFVQYAEENGISLEDIQKLSEAKKGNKGAIGAIAKDASVDIYELSEDDKYEPEPIQLPTQVDPRLDITANEILSNDEHREAFQKWFPTIPEDIQAEITGKAEVLASVQEDLAAGVFEPAMEQAYKYQRIDGMDFGSAYSRAKSEVIALRGEQKPAPTVTRGERIRASGSRGSASVASTPRGGYAEGVISDMSDEQFFAEYNDIVASFRKQG